MERSEICLTPTHHRRSFWDMFLHKPWLIKRCETACPRWVKKKAHSSQPSKFNNYKEERTLRTKARWLLSWPCNLSVLSKRYVKTLSEINRYQGPEHGVVKIWGWRVQRVKAMTGHRSYKQWNYQQEANRAVLLRALLLQKTRIWHHLFKKLCSGHQNFDHQEFEYPEKLDPWFPFMESPY